MQSTARTLLDKGVTVDVRALRRIPRKAGEISLAVLRPLLVQLRTTSRELGDRVLAASGATNSSHYQGHRKWLLSLCSGRRLR